MSSNHQRIFEQEDISLAQNPQDTVARRLQIGAIAGVVVVVETSRYYIQHTKLYKRQYNNVRTA